MKLCSAETLDQIMPRYPAIGAAARRQVLADTEHFLRAQVRGAPAHVRLGVVALGFGFRTWMAAAAALGRYPAMALERWDSLSGGPGRAYLRLLRSLAVLSYLEHSLVLGGLGMAQVPEQQARFRRLRAQSASATATPANTTPATQS